METLTVSKALELLKPRVINKIINAANRKQTFEMSGVVKSEAALFLYAYFVKELEAHPGAYIPPMELDQDEINFMRIAMFGDE